MFEDKKGMAAFIINSNNLKFYTEQKEICSYCIYSPVSAIKSVGVYQCGILDFWAPCRPEGPSAQGTEGRRSSLGQQDRHWKPSQEQGSWGHRDSPSPSHQAPP